MTNREILLLVAEKVMGWERIESGGLVWWELNGRRGHPDSAENPIPNYPKDIAAAWEVVERLNSEGESFGLQGVGPSPSRWEAEFGFAMEFTMASVLADTAPMAICLAALKTVGVTI